MFGIDDLLRLVREDWDEETYHYSDEELNEDRSEWIKTYGWYNEPIDEETNLITDIHTISIELEQLRRNGEIYYDLKNPSKKNMVTEKWREELLNRKRKNK
jgi:hypothetical protein|tara:strand:- start:207 stop:509 length:303 start_codon:yes stop_codon:yes gene_type:complete